MALERVGLEGKEIRDESHTNFRYPVQWERVLQLLRIAETRFSVSEHFWNEAKSPEREFSEAEPVSEVPEVSQSFLKRTYSFFSAFRARTLNQIGVPLNPNAARIWFSRNRSKLKCSLISRSVNRMNVGGATAACVI